MTISKETTRITAPLRKDGYVDYVTALNEHFRAGVTVRNNAAVLFWQAMGPRRSTHSTARNTSSDWVSHHLPRRGTITSR